MMEKKLVAGQVVMLKTGSPKMTVNLIQSAHRVQCTWFNGKKNETAFFHPDALVLVQDEELSEENNDE